MPTTIQRCAAACCLGVAWFGVAAGVAAPQATAKSAAESTAVPPAIEIEAERAEFDVRAGHAVLSGNVHVRSSEWELSCARAELRYGKGESISGARASGGVVFRLQAIEATAPAVELELDARRATFRQGVTLRQGGGWAKARSATVDLDTYKVAMTGVQGTFPIDDRRR